MSNTLCVMFFGMMNLDGPPQLLCSCYECVYGMSVSLCPCMISVGHVTLFIYSLFCSRSLTIIDGIDPNKDLTASLRDV